MQTHTHRQTHAHTQRHRHTHTHHTLSPISTIRFVDSRWICVSFKITRSEQHTNRIQSRPIHIFTRFCFSVKSRPIVNRLDSETRWIYCERLLLAVGISPGTAGLFLPLLANDCIKTQKPEFRCFLSGHNVFLNLITGPGGLEPPLAHFTRLHQTHPLYHCLVKPFYCTFIAIDEV